MLKTDQTDPTISENLLRPGSERFGAILEYRKDTVNKSSENADRILDLIIERDLHTKNIMGGVATDYNWYGKAAGLQVAGPAPEINADELYEQSHSEYVDGLQLDFENHKLSKGGQAVSDAREATMLAFEAQSSASDVYQEIEQLTDENFTSAA